MQTGERHPAIEDVEALQEQLLEVRAQRKRVEAEFDAFTNGFRTGQPPQSARALLPPAPVGRGRTRAASGMAALPTGPEAPEPVPGVPHALADSAASRRVNGRVMATVAAVAAIAMVLVAAIALRNNGSQPEGATVTAQPTPSEPVPAPAAAAAPTVTPPPGTAPADAAAVNVTMITRRRVWMRVTLDGKRAFEREVDAGQQIPLRADRSIVIRAGDAGAIAVVWNGRDAGTIGRDGVVGTREFTRDAAAR
jgi:hypothetical protein